MQEFSSLLDIVAIGQRTDFRRGKVRSPVLPAQDVVQPKTSFEQKITHQTVAQELDVCPHVLESIVRKRSARLPIEDREELADFTEHLLLISKLMAGLRIKLDDFQDSAVPSDWLHLQIKEELKGVTLFSEARLLGALCILPAAGDRLSHLARKRISELLSLHLVAFARLSAAEGLQKNAPPRELWNTYDLIHELLTMGKLWLSQWLVSELDGLEADLDLICHTYCLHVLSENSET